MLQTVHIITNSIILIALTYYYYFTIYFETKRYNSKIKHSWK